MVRSTPPFALDRWNWRSWSSSCVNLCSTSFSNHSQHLHAYIHAAHMERYASVCAHLSTPNCRSRPRRGFCALPTMAIFTYFSNILMNSLKFRERENPMYVPTAITATTATTKRQKSSSALTTIRTHSHSSDEKSKCSSHVCTYIYISVLVTAEWLSSQTLGWLAAHPVVLCCGSARQLDLIITCSQAQSRYDDNGESHFKKKNKKSVKS